MYSNFNATPFPALCGLDNRLLCTGNLLRAQELTLVHIEVVAVASESSHGLRILASSISAAMICAQTSKERIWSAANVLLASELENGVISTGYDTILSKPCCDLLFCIGLLWYHKVQGSLLRSALVQYVGF
jgi:hypothetical protein